MHKGKDGLVMEVREIYKISDMIHKAAGWKKENVFLFLIRSVFNELQSFKKKE